MVATLTATATATPETSTPTPTPEPRAVIAFVGDLMLDRDVEIALVADPTYPFARAQELFADSDLVVGNLEGTLSVGGTPLTKKYQFQTEPAAAVAALRAGGLDAVSLANNHATDYGLDGLTQTLDALGGADGIANWGAGLTEVDARREIILAAGGLRIAFLGYNDIPEVVTADGERGGVSTASVDAIREDVRRASARTDVDSVVVTLHAGTEYSHVVTARQQELARAAIDAGASLVVGHHPHVLQPIEEYRDGVILYSLGNFLFDLDPDDLATLGEGPFQSVVAVVRFEADRPPAVVLHPVRIDVTENRPRPATAEEAAAILAIIEGNGQ